MQDNLPIKGVVKDQLHDSLLPDDQQCDTIMAQYENTILVLKLLEYCM